MSSFQLEKLFVDFLPATTPFSPLDTRKYTLKHSDETGQLFLTIGTDYHIGKIDSITRDEVFAEWIVSDGQYILSASVHVSGGEFDFESAKIRSGIFEKELPLALEALCTGDRVLFCYFPWLLSAQIYIFFESDYPELQKMVKYGTVRQFIQ